MTQQDVLFGASTDAAMTIAEVACAVNASRSSVRNWIKTGYLKESNNGVSRRSFDHFRAHVAGNEKLVGRANKSRVDRHDHGALTARIAAALRQPRDLGAVGDEYQRALSDAHRNKEGVYYTPESVCDAMLSEIPTPGGDATFCDPCCGSGNFMMAAIRHGFKPENIFGYDTDPVAVDIARRRVLSAAGGAARRVARNIVCGDFLEAAAAAGDGTPGYDAIATNPPWGKKLG